MFAAAVVAAAEDWWCCDVHVDVHAKAHHMKGWLCRQIRLLLQSCIARMPRATAAVSSCAAAGLLCVECMLKAQAVVLCVITGYCVFAGTRYARCKILQCYCVVAGFMLLHVVVVFRCDSIHTAASSCCAVITATTAS